MFVNEFASAPALNTVLVADCETINAIVEEMGPATGRRILDGVVRDIDQRLDQLGLSIRRHANDDVRFLAHSLCGLLGQFGLQRAAMIAGQIERDPGGAHDPELLDLSRAIRAGLVAFDAVLVPAELCA